MAELIQCKFNLFDEGRKYTGHHRKYILENAKSVCYSPYTREKIALNEALGYFGHGRREKAGKIRINEVETIMEKGKAIIVENIPSNVTTQFDVLDDGTVTHTQRILESAPGQIVSSLNKSKVGGFSWACGGSDGKSVGATVLSSFEGFDYVMMPGFSGNRGYILENASTDERDMILESITKSGMSDTEAEMVLESWIASAQWKALDLESKLLDADGYIADLNQEIESVKTASRQASDRIAILERAHEERKKMILESIGKHHLFIPVDVAEAMISMASETDFHKVVGYFESANTVEMANLPLPKKVAQKMQQRVAKKHDDLARGYDFCNGFKFGQ